jgi:hypothetical protein
MTGIETAVPGWESIALTLNCSVQTAIKKKEEFMAAGVIFYRMVGRPPQKRVFHFPSRLREWTGLKAAKGEII